MTISTQEFTLLKEYIERNCGICVPSDKTYLIESRMAQMVIETGSRDFREFYEKAISDRTGKLRDQIVDAITTNETLWFRDGKPWAIFKEVLMPEMAQKLVRGERSRIRIWSAASSTGQEAYSMAMTIDGLYGMGGGNGITPAQFEILGTDISPSVLFLAIAGRYNQIEISRGLDEFYRNKYFTKQGTVWVLNDALRKRVTFKRYNLQDSFAPLGQFDIIFCRNVAIYFSDEFKRGLFAKMAQSLTPGGYFMLGSAESLSGYSTAFQMLTYKDGIYYKKAGAT